MQWYITCLFLVELFIRYDQNNIMNIAREFSVIFLGAWCMGAILLGFTASNCYLAGGSNGESVKEKTF